MCRTDCSSLYRTIWTRPFHPDRREGLWVAAPPHAHRSHRWPTPPQPRGPSCCEQQQAPGHTLCDLGFRGAPCRIRTDDLRITSALLWPSELRRHIGHSAPSPAAGPLYTAPGTSGHGLPGLAGPRPQPCVACDGMRCAPPTACVAGVVGRREWCVSAALPGRRPGRGGRAAPCGRGTGPRGAGDIGCSGLLTDPETTGTVTSSSPRWTRPLFHFPVGDPFLYSDRPARSCR